MEATYSSQALDHLGLVAGMCKELEIAKLIDNRIPSNKKEVSHGNALCAMILNGLGFTNQRLYLVSHFFKKKPVERLLQADITAEKLNDACLGRTLDALYSYGPSELFSELSAQAVKILGLDSKFAHLDSTSMHVDGKYNSEESPEEGVVHIVPGYSRDHRPALNQIVINMIVESKGSIPIYMNVASGNSSDKTDFREILKQHVDQLQNNFTVEYVVADSALYSAESIQTLNDIVFFITRVPETINEAKQLIELVDLEQMQEIDENYQYIEVCSTYGEVRQRWVLIHSKHAAKRELKTLDKKYLKGSDEERKKFAKLTRQEFACEADALKELARFEKKLRFTTLCDLKVLKRSGYTKPGKPKQGSKPDKIGYFLDGAVASCMMKRDKMVKSKGFFIIASNELDVKKLSAIDIFHAYKDQGKVERGFRFLKNHEFLASSLFLKKPERIMALAMVMTLCLMIYAALEHRIRQELAKSKETFPNQKNKEIANPTARWVFHYFVGIHVLQVPGEREITLNVTERHRQIIYLLGYQSYYS